MITQVANAEIVSFNGENRIIVQKEGETAKKHFNGLPVQLLGWKESVIKFFKNTYFIEIL